MRSALVAAALLLLLLGAAADARAERIREFEVDLRVDKNGRLHV